MKKYFTPFNIVFNIIGNIVLLLAIYYLVKDWKTMSGFDLIIGFICISIVIVAHIALFYEYKKPTK